MNSISMNKIGILTQPLHNNYGGLLQNYAMQQVLINMGLSPETIDHGSPDVGKVRMIMSKIKQFLIFKFHLDSKTHTRYQPSKKEFDTISRNSKYFINKYITHTPPFKSVDDLKRIIANGNYDGYLVGSDQCWRPSYSGVFLREMFLNLADEPKNVIRIAYAVSFGTDQWEFTTEMTNECARLAKKFDLISVREKSGVNLCEKYLGVESVHVLDPTLLLSKDNYIELVIKEKETNRGGDLFYYILDPCQEKTSFINKVSSSLGLTAFTILPRCQAENRTYQDVKYHIEDCVYPSVTSWLRGFMDAKMVVVDSFHGAVFSIIFNKPFWVMGNKKRGNARFESLLELFHLEDRMISPDDLSSVDWNAPIDWDSVNVIWSEEQKRCLDLLNKTFNQWKKK